MIIPARTLERNYLYLSIFLFPIAISQLGILNHLVAKERTFIRPEIQAELPPTTYLELELLAS